MGAAESKPLVGGDEDFGAAIDAAAADHEAAGGGARLVRVPGSLAGGPAELRAAVAALVGRLGGVLPGAEERGGIELEIPHIAQEGTWDCGVACIQMALTYAQQLEQLSQDEHEQEEEEDVGRAALLARVGTESIWTVDLLFLLQARLLGYMARTGRAVLFATTAPGVCLQYSQVAYYARQFDRDVARVLARFRQAQEEGLTIYEGSLPWQTLRDLLLTGRALLVLLVDSRLLPRPPPPQPPSASTTTTNNGTAQPQPPPPPQQQQQQQQPQPQPQSQSLATGAYCGHYILLTGYRAHPPAFFYKDPARPTVGGDHLIDTAVLDAARTSYGTDEDVLVIEVPPPPPPS